MSIYLLLPRLHIHNANALSSPFTVGFPAMTAWLGAAHFLERIWIREVKFRSVRAEKVGVVSHEFSLNTYKGKKDFVHSIVGTGNPLKKTGERSSFIEEARCHLKVSLVLQIKNLDPFAKDYFLDLIARSLQKMKFASGDLLSFDTLKTFADSEGQQRKLISYLMPGYGLIERRDIMREAMEKKDALDALLDGIKVKYKSEKDKEGTVSWPPGKRKYPGWIVPIATGFHGISDVTKAGDTLNQRDPSVPHRFAESVVTLGEFVMPYRFDSISELLWQYNYYPEKNLYICENQQAN